MQQVLDFGTPYRYTFDLFVQSDNQLLINRLKSIRPGSSNNADSLLITGDSGSGKTHLLHSYCDYWQSLGRQPVFVAAREQGFALSSLNEQLENLELVVVDDINLLSSTSQQHNLYHLLSQALLFDIPLLLSMDSLKKSEDFFLRDVVSRLHLLPCMQVCKVREEHLGRFIQTYSASLGLQINRELANFIYARYSRDMQSIRVLIDRLDVLSSRNLSKISYSLIKQAALELRLNP